VPTALADGAVVVLPGTGGYQLAARVDRPSAMARFAALTPSLAGGSVAERAVGRTEQAIALAADWTDETRRLTDRHWPGPLTVIVPAADPDQPGGGSVSLIMPPERPLRRWCREGGPLALATLRGADGQPLTGLDEVRAHCSRADVAVILDGGTRAGPAPTVVDCRVAPPEVRLVGALPLAYIEAARLVGARRRGWFRRAPPRLPGTP
jgi:L-threonylcarbamoyladenylate synthase